jgi:hypothetical protein
MKPPRHLMPWSAAVGVAMMAAAAADAQLYHVLGLLAVPIFVVGFGFVLRGLRLIPP